MVELKEKTIYFRILNQERRAAFDIAFYPL